MTVKLSSSLVSSISANISSLFNSGYIRIYSGSRPASPDAATGSALLLAEIRFPAGSCIPASPVSGSIVFSPLTQDDSANNTGTANWFRVFKSDLTALFDGSIGTSGSDLNMTNTSITASYPVAIASFKLNFPVA